VSSRTMAGCVGPLLGVAIIVRGSLGRISLIGDFLALWMTTAMALIMAIYRKYPDPPGAGPAALSSVLLLPFVGIFGNPFYVESTEVFVLSAFGLLFAIASVTLAEGAKRVPSGQTALSKYLGNPSGSGFRIHIAYGNSRRRNISWRFGRARCGAFLDKNRYVFTEFTSAEVVTHSSIEADSEWDSESN
jgi:hypothetical protein